MDGFGFHRRMYTEQDGETGAASCVQQGWATGELSRSEAEGYRMYQVHPVATATGFASSATSCPRRDEDGVLATWGRCHPVAWSLTDRDKRFA